ncbi:MAG: TetR/AcrR family transcriptional regulator [Holophagaceae bacterium]|nr:TetR/AcrR family transcriptional regulator [Holophagaceae bacterium]
MPRSGQSPAPKTRGPKAAKVDTDQILDAARKVFSLEGLKGSSIRAIAREAGCDPALIYYHFESKEAMFLALVDQKLTPLAAALKDLAAETDQRPASLRLWDVLQTYKAHFSCDAGFRSMLRGEILRGAEGTRDAMALHIRRTAGTIWELLRQGQDRGELLPGLHPPLTTFFFVRTYMEILDLIPVMGARVDLVDAADAVAVAERAWFRLFWRGIAADPTSPLPPGPWDPPLESTRPEPA